MDYHLSLTGVPEMKHVIGMINDIENVHFHEVPPYKTYSYPELRKKII